MLKYITPFEAEIKAILMDHCHKAEHEFAAKSVNEINTAIEALQDDLLENSHNDHALAIAVGRIGGLKNLLVTKH